ncbi:MAG: DUF3592 domain-containing protein [Chloroflexota bacterium]
MDTLTTFIVVGAVGGSALLVNAIFLVSIFSTQRKASAAQHWPTAAGAVIESRLESRRSSNNRGWVNYPRVMYTYNVGGQSYVSNRVSPGMEVGGTSAPGVIAKYPVGSQVKAYYNPHNPSEAVLETNTPASVKMLWFVLVIVNLMMCGIGLPFLIFS